jgi:signal transduction histidine kinase
MTRRSDGLWGVGGLLMAAAALPTLLMLLIVAVTQVGADARIRHELEQRAALVASALAEASEYGLISGNPAALDRSARDLLDEDRAIASIDILDATRRPFVSLSAPVPRSGLVTVERPVRSNVPDIDFFDQPTPHVSLPDDVQPTFRLGPVVGYARVTMSAQPLRGAQQQRLAEQLAAIAMTGAIGILAVGLLARRIAASAQAVRAALGALRDGRYDVHEGPPPIGELKAVQDSVIALADALAARPAARAADGRTTGATTSPSQIVRIGEDAPAQEARHERVARRIVGRLDAALVTVRLAAGHVAHLAETAETDAAKERASETAVRILAIADHLATAGPALMEPMRTLLVRERGLDAALEELRHACALAHPACTFTLQKDADFQCADPAQALAIHRAVQEAMTHVVAFSNATEAVVRLAAQAGSREVRVVISDNGEGEDSKASNLRLARIRDSFAALGGRMDVRRSAVGGTTMVLTLPASAPA